MTMKWARDGDQHVAKGGLGEYRITVWNVRGEEKAVLTFLARGSRGSKSLGTFSSAANAKYAAQGYDGYRSMEKQASR